MTRTYVCPQCGYDQFRAVVNTTVADSNIQWNCPACLTLRGVSIVLVETSDPRDEAT